MHQFVCFLDDGQVCRELRIKDFLEPKTPQSGDHLARDKTSGCHAHGFADPDADRRSGLHYDDFVRVQELFEHFVGIVPFDDGSSGANECALAAVRARNVAQALLHIRGDSRLDATVGKADGMHGLDSAAHGDTPAAKNALVRIPYQRK